MMLAGPQQAATGEPEGISLSAPLAAAQLAEAWMHAVKMLTLFDPELETNRLLSSAVAHVVVAELMPAQREKARPAGFAPTGTQYPGAVAQGLGLGAGRGVSAPLLS